MLTLTIRDPRYRGGSGPSFEATLPDGTVLCRSSNPTMAAARALIALGHDPDMLMTSRHAGQDHDTWTPAPIAAFAHWTVGETDSGMKRTKWHPYPAV